MGARLEARPQVAQAHIYEFAFFQQVVRKFGI
jgi:hypothetical protein